MRGRSLSSQLSRLSAPWRMAPQIMTFARLLLEIRRRAAGLPNDLPRSTALEQAAREALEMAGPQQEHSRKIMAALLGIGDDQEFDPAVLDSLTPEMVLRLDLIADQMLELGRTDDAVRAIRAALIRPVS